MPVEKVTIGIPCYNAQASIADAVSSGLGQEWPDFEVLVIDDCSSDESAEIVHSMAKADKRIRLVRKAVNEGVGAARNTILKESQADFIVFFDDDDQSHPSRLKTQYQRLIQHENLTGEILLACYASGERKYPNGYTLPLSAIGSRLRPPVGEEAADYLLFNNRKRGVFYGSGTPASALMARKSTFEKAGGFDPNFRRVEDSDFAIRLGILGGTFIGCPENLYTQHATQGSDKTASANFSAELKLLEKHKEYLESKNRYRYARNWFQLRYHHFNGERGKALFALVKCWVNDPLLTTRQFLRSAPRRMVHELRSDQVENRS